MKSLRLVFRASISSFVFILALNSAAQLNFGNYRPGTATPSAFQAGIDDAASDDIEPVGQTACSVIVRMSTSDGDGVIQGMKVVVENRTTGKTYTQTTDAQGSVSFPDDPASAQLFITRLIFVQHATQYVFDSGVTKPANASRQFFIIPKSNRITANKFRVDLRFSKLIITTRLAKDKSLVDSKVNIKNDRQEGMISAAAIGGTAEIYLPAGTDVVRNDDDKIRVAKIFIAAEYTDPATGLFSEAVKEESFPPLVQIHELMLLDMNSWFTEVKAEMYQLLTDVSGEDVAKRVDKLTYKIGNKTAFDQGTIELVGLFRPTSAQDSESIFHEWTHAIMEMGFGSNEPGGTHPNPCARYDRNLAWTEGRAHFSATLLTQILNKPRTNAFTRSIALNCAQMLSDPGTPGEEIETVVAASMLEYYSAQYGKDHNLVDIYREFLNTHQGPRHTTVNQFFGLARSLGDGREADLTEQIQILYRLKLAPTGFFKLKINGDTVGTEGTAIDLASEVTTKNDFPVFDGFRDKIRVEWTESGKVIGKDPDLHFLGTSGEHLIKVQVVGRLTEKEEMIAEDTVKIIVLPKLGLEFTGPTEVKRADTITVEAVPMGADGKPATLKPELKPTYSWSVFKPGDYTRNPISFPATEAKEWDIPVELRMEVEGKPVVVAAGIYRVRVNPDNATPTPTPTPTPSPTPSPTPAGPDGGSTTVEFGGNVPGIWDGGKNPSGFDFKRELAKATTPGECKWEAQVHSEIWGRINPSFAPSNPAELAKKMDDLVADAKRWGHTATVRTIAIGDFKGQFLDSSVRFAPGGWSDAGYRADGVAAYGRGWVIKGRHVVEVGYNVGGAGCWTNVDQPFLMSHATAAQAEAKGIVAGLTLVEKGVFTKGPYNGPKLDGSDLPKVTLSPPSLEKLKVGDNVRVTVMVENAKPEDPPFKYDWGGVFDGKPETSRDKASITIKPVKAGKFPLTVSVEGARFTLGSASLEYEVVDYKAEIKQDKPTAKKVAVGTPVTFSARLLSGGVPAAGSFIYRWQPTPEVEFDPIESGKNTTTATFSRPGITKVWVQVLEKKGTVLSTLAESDQIEIEAVEPELTIKFDPAKVFVGKEVKTSVEVTPAELKDIDLRWEVSANARQTTESQDKREITIIPQNAEPVTVTVRARVPVKGDDLGEKTATITADKYDVKLNILGTEGPKPQIWKEGVGLVPLDRGIAVHQFVGARAEITPAVEGARFEWLVNEDTHFESNSITQQIRVSRSQVGSGELTVIVRDRNGLEVGRASNAFSVTVSQADLDKAKEKAAPTPTPAPTPKPTPKATQPPGNSAGTFIKQGDDAYEKGDYQSAIDAYDKALAADPNSAAAYAGRCLAKRGVQDYAGASADCDRALQLDPNNAAAYRGRSMAKRANNDFQGALADADRAVRLGPDNYRSYLTRGLAKDGLKDVKGALADYDRAISLNPGYTPSYAYRGLARLNLGDNRGALADLNIFIAGNSSNSSAHNNRGLAKERLGDVDGAISDYEKAIALDPGNETAKRNLSRVRPPTGTAVQPGLYRTDSRGITYELSAVTGGTMRIGEWATTTPQPPSPGGDFYNAGTATLMADGRTWHALNKDVAGYCCGNNVEIEFQFVSPTSFKLTRARIWPLGASIGPDEGWQTAPAEEFRLVDHRSDSKPVGPLATLASGTFHVIANTSAFDVVLTVTGSTFTGTANGEKITKGTINGNTVTFHLTTRYISQGQDYEGTIQWGKIIGKFTGAPNAIGRSYWEWELDLTPVGTKPVPTPAPTPRPITTPVVAGPAGAEAVIFKNTNIGGVANAPAVPTQFTISRPHMITYLFTYHWNDARGSTRPGTIALQRSDGTVYGPFATRGTPGQGGVPNANWEAVPNVVIPAGTYTIVDSSPATWAQNGESGGRGHAIVKGYPADGGAVTAVPTAVKPPTKPTVPPPVNTPGQGLIAIFENRSSEPTHIFAQGDTFGPGNKLAAGEKREVRVTMDASGRVKFTAGRNGQVISSNTWTGIADDLNRFPRVVFDGSQLIITTGLR